MCWSSVALVPPEDLSPFPKPFTDRGAPASIIAFSGAKAPDVSNLQESLPTVSRTGLTDVRDGSDFDADDIVVESASDSSPSYRGNAIRAISSMCRPRCLTNSRRDFHLPSPRQSALHSALHSSATIAALHPCRQWLAWTAKRGHFSLADDLSHSHIQIFIEVHSFRFVSRCYPHILDCLPACELACLLVP